MRRWLALCLALALMGLAPAGGLAEGVRVGAPLDGASEAQRANISLAEGVRASTPLDGASEAQRANINSRPKRWRRAGENGRALPFTRRSARAPGKRLRAAINGGARRRWRRRSPSPPAELGADAAQGIQTSEATYANQSPAATWTRAPTRSSTDFKQGIDFGFENGCGDFTIRIRTTDAPSSAR